MSDEGMKSGMSKQTRKPKHKTGKLKAFLFSSSLLATLAGTQLLNINGVLHVPAIADNTVPSNGVASDQVIITLPEAPAARGDEALPRLTAPTRILQQTQPFFRPLTRARSSR